MSQRLGTRATRYPRPPDSDAAALTLALLATAGVEDVIVTEGHVAVLHQEGEPPAEVAEVLARSHRGGAVVARRHRVRVRYDGEDLELAARTLDMPVGLLVARHLARAYRVQLVGFLPGFAYLGPLDPRLVLPRRASPRARVPAGALAMAGPYTAIYPGSSPGGWWLLGTAVDFVAMTDDGPRFNLGDEVSFEVAV